MKRFLRDYFSFTRTETRVILVLSVIWLLMLLLRILIGSGSPVNYVPDEIELKIIEEFVTSINERKELKFPESSTRSRRFYHNLKKFDPNLVQLEEMENMGFPANVSGNINKYRQSGGRFNSPIEIGKIYGLSDSALRLITPFVYIEEEIKEIKPKKQEILNQVQIKTNIEDTVRIDINSADSIQLTRLKGIGPVFASRIVKYRKRLGGFSKGEQLLEVYGISPDQYNLFKDRIWIDTMNIKKIKINMISKEELKRHPYINEELAESMIKFRDFRGKIADIRELYLFDVADEEKLQKIEFYLDFKE